MNGPQHQFNTEDQTAFSLREQQFIEVFIIAMQFLKPGNFAFFVIKFP